MGLKLDSYEIKKLNELKKQIQNGNVSNINMDSIHKTRDASFYNVVYKKGIISSSGIRAINYSDFDKELFSLMVHLNPSDSDTIRLITSNIGHSYLVYNYQMNDKEFLKEIKRLASFRKDKKIERDVYHLDVFSDTATFKITNHTKIDYITMNMDNPYYDLFSDIENKENRPKLLQFKYKINN